MTPVRLLWTGQSANTKTGNVPTAWVGPDLDAARASCAGCPLLAGGCYAHNGTPLMASWGHYRRHGEGAPMTLDRALRESVRGARFVRVTALGDAAGRRGVERTALLGDLARARRARLGVLGYTHHWRAEPRTGALRRELMASCEGAAAADEAIARGWRAAALVPSDTPGKFVATPGGRRLVICPHERQARDGVPAVKRITCNECGLCDPRAAAWRSGRQHGVAFLAGGPRRREADRVARGACS